MALKASPTIQRLIRDHQLESMAMAATGPKGTVVREDVEAALAVKQEADAAALTPITIDLAPMTTHLFEQSLMPTQAVTNKKELVGYFTQMYSLRRMEIAADVLYKSKLVKGFCHLYDGQEAINIGIEAAASRRDSVVTSYRDHTWQVTRGEPAGSKCPPWQCPSSAPAPPRGAPGGPVQLGTPRVGLGHWDPSQGLGCSSEPPPKSPIPVRLSVQASR